MMAGKLAESDVKLVRNRYDNTFKIFPKDTDVRLRNPGPMLGFSENATVRANTWTNSPSNVDVNLGLRYVTVECSSVDTDRNFDRYRKRSKVIVTLPVTTEQSLNSSVTHYRGHVHEIQTYHQETQVPKNLRERSCGPGATGPGRQGEVRKQEQGVSLDTNGCRDSEPIRLCNPRSQEGR